MSRNFSSFSQKLLRTQDRDDMNIRKAAAADVPAAAAIYERIHDMEEQGKAVIGWIRASTRQRRQQGRCSAIFS